MSKFGRALSYKARLYCAYFSLGVQGLGAPYGTRYPHRTLPFAYALTDNVQMVNDLRRLWGALPGPGVVELPARVEAADEGTFLARLEARRLKAGQRSPQRRWLWVSRVESFKGTSILAKIAPTLPNDQFELFGPISGSLPDLGLTAPNIRHCGILSDIASSDFSTYDGFLFTSLFEGMPNVVLEMSQHAIPMALADVGGLRGTLSDASVMFVRHGQTVEESAANYVSALEGIGNLTTLELLVMVETARAQVLRRHSPTAYHDNVARIFSYGASDV
ncbi:MAG: glycosyltransferase [Candidatus Accumulibacter sp.]|uniref:Glycosyltransferase n=1 Tax=Candidatus Accumulibacter affinis TaxID=2954384 RepID=A0A935T8J2_9PROT|nr:glycosyltransferase [Candidatus Accumulibacter affinis]